MKVADMHCDTISEIYYAIKDGKDYTLAKNHLHMDLNKMIKGDYFLQNFALFVNVKKFENPLEHCLELIDFYYQQIAEYQDKIALAYNYDDIRKNKEAGKISGILTIEEGGTTNCSLANLRNFYRLGVRMLTLTWNYENGIGYPNFKLIPGQVPDFKNPELEHGLTAFGLELIDEMEQLGMIIDVSHLSDAGFYQVLHNTSKPFVASHSNARHACNHSRNLTDDMIRKLSERGGVMGINFCPAFLDDTKEESELLGTIDTIVRHIKHIQSVGGCECIGLGSDFDGIPTHAEIPDASYMPLLAEHLAKSGIKHHEIEAIFSKNVMRLYKDVLK